MKVCVLDGLKIPTDLEETLKEKGIKIIYELKEDCNAIVIRNITKVNRAFLKRLPSLKYIIRAGVGLDNVDLKLCEERNIKVINSPGSNAFSVAELFFFHVLNAYRRGCENIKEVKNTLIFPNRSLYIGMSFKDKVIGIIGLGNIGKEIVKRLQGWEVRKILAYDIIKDESFSKEYKVEYIDDLKVIFEKAHIIAICIPLNEHTKGMIHYKIFKECKNTPLIVNLSRGKIVKTQDVLRALNENLITGYCSDVIENEENPTQEDKELISHPKVFITSHIGANTYEALDNMIRIAINRFIKAISQKEEHLFKK